MRFLLFVFTRLHATILFHSRCKLSTTCYKQSAHATIDLRSRHKLNAQPTRTVAGKANEWRRQPRKCPVGPRFVRRELGGAVLRSSSIPEKKLFFTIREGSRNVVICFPYTSGKTVCLPNVWPAPTTHHRSMCENGGPRVDRSLEVTRRIHSSWRSRLFLWSMSVEDSASQRFQLTIYVIFRCFLKFGFCYDESCSWQAVVKGYLQNSNFKRNVAFSLASVLDFFTSEVVRSFSSINWSHLILACCGTQTISKECCNPSRKCVQLHRCAQHNLILVPEFRVWRTCHIGVYLEGFC